MMNNLQKDLQKNVEKYNGKYHLHKKVKVINCYHCYPISTEVNIPDNFIKFWDWISIFHSAKSCTSLILFYFKRVIKARAERNRNAIISNISELCQTIIFDPIPIEIDKVENSDSEFELNINILLEPENLENIENLIEMDAKQFAEVLKDAGLSQKLVEPEEFYGKVEEDPLDFLKKFEEASEVNNWSNKRKIKLISRYLKGNAKFWFEDLPETNYWIAEDFSEDAEDTTQNFTDQFKAKFVTEEKKQNWYTQLSKLKQKKGETTTTFTNKFIESLTQIKLKYQMELSYQCINRH